MTGLNGIGHQIGVGQAGTFRFVSGTTRVENRRQILTGNLSRRWRLSRIQHEVGHQPTT